MYVYLHDEALMACRSGQPDPPDFDAFWSATLATSRSLARPPVAKLHESPLRSVDIYDVRFSGFGGQRGDSVGAAPCRCDASKIPPQKCTVHPLLRRPWGQQPCTPSTHIDPFAVALRDQDSCARAPGASHVLTGLVRAWAQPLHGAGPAAQAEPGLRVGYA